MIFLFFIKILLSMWELWQDYFQSFIELFDFIVNIKLIRFIKLLYTKP